MSYKMENMRLKDKGDINSPVQGTSPIISELTEMSNITRKDIEDSEDSYTEIRVTVYIDNSILLKENYCKDAKTENVRDNIKSMDEFIQNGNRRFNKVFNNSRQKDKEKNIIKSINKFKNSLETETANELKKCRTTRRLSQKLIDISNRNIFSLLSLNENSSINIQSAKINVKTEPIDKSFDKVKVNSFLKCKTGEAEKKQYFQEQHNISDGRICKESDYSLPTDNNENTSDYEGSSCGLLSDDEVKEESLDPVRFKTHFKCENKLDLDDDLPEISTPKNRKNGYKTVWETGDEKRNKHINFKGESDIVRHHGKTSSFQKERNPSKYSESVKRHAIETTAAASDHITRTSYKHLFATPTKLTEIRTKTATQHDHGMGSFKQPLNSEDDKCTLSSPESARCSVDSVNKPKTPGLVSSSCKGNNSCKHTRANKDNIPHKGDTTENLNQTPKKNRELCEKVNMTTNCKVENTVDFVTKNEKAVGSSLSHICSSKSIDYRSLESKIVNVAENIRKTTDEICKLQKFLPVITDESENTPETTSKTLKKSVSEDKLKSFSPEKKKSSPLCYENTHDINEMKNFSNKNLTKLKVNNDHHHNPNSKDDKNLVLLSMLEKDCSQPKDQETRIRTNICNSCPQGNRNEVLTFKSPLKNIQKSMLPLKEISPLSQKSTHRVYEIPKNSMFSNELNAESKHYDNTKADGPSMQLNVREKTHSQKKGQETVQNTSCNAHPKNKRENAEIAIKGTCTSKHSQLEDIQHKLKIPTLMEEVINSKTDLEHSNRSNTSAHGKKFEKSSSSTSKYDFKCDTYSSRKCNGKECHRNDDERRYRESNYKSRHYRDSDEKYRRYSYQKNARRVDDKTSKTESSDSQRPHGGKDTRRTTTEKKRSASGDTVITTRKSACKHEEDIHVTEHRNRETIKSTNFVENRGLPCSATVNASDFKSCCPSETLSNSKSGVQKSDYKSTGSVEMTEATKNQNKCQEQVVSKVLEKRDSSKAIDQLLSEEKSISLESCRNETKTSLDFSENETRTDSHNNLKETQGYLELKYNKIDNKWQRSSDKTNNHDLRFKTSNNHLRVETNNNDLRVKTNLKDLGVKTNSNDLGVMLKQSNETNISNLEQSDKLSDNQTPLSSDGYINSVLDQSAQMSMTINANNNSTRETEQMIIETGTQQDTSSLEPPNPCCIDMKDSKSSRRNPNVDRNPPVEGINMCNETHDNIPTKMDSSNEVQKSNKKTLLETPMLGPVADTSSDGSKTESLKKPLLKTPNTQINMITEHVSLERTMKQPLLPTPRIDNIIGNAMGTKKPLLEIPVSMISLEVRTKEAEIFSKKPTLEPPKMFADTYIMENELKDPKTEKTLKITTEVGNGTNNKMKDKQIQEGDVNMQNSLVKTPEINEKNTGNTREYQHKIQTNTHVDGNQLQNDEKRHENSDSCEILISTVKVNEDMSSDNIVLENLQKELISIEYKVEGSGSTERKFEDAGFTDLKVGNSDFSDSKVENSGSTDRNVEDSCSIYPSSKKPVLNHLKSDKWPHNIKKRTVKVDQTGSHIKWKRVKPQLAVSHNIEEPDHCDDSSSHSLSSELSSTRTETNSRTEKSVSKRKVELISNRYSSRNRTGKRKLKHSDDYLQHGTLEYKKRKFMKEDSTIQNVETTTRRVKTSSRRSSPSICEKTTRSKKETFKRGSDETSTYTSKRRSSDEYEYKERRREYHLPCSKYENESENYTREVLSSSQTFSDCDNREYKEIPSLLSVVTRPTKPTKIGSEIRSGPERCFQTVRMYAFDCLLRFSEQNWESIRICPEDFRFQLRQQLKRNFDRYLYDVDDPIYSNMGPQPRFVSEETMIYAISETIRNPHIAPSIEKHFREFDEIIGYVGFNIPCYWCQVEFRYGQFFRALPVLDPIGYRYDTMYCQ